MLIHLKLNWASDIAIKFLKAAKLAMQMQILVKIVKPDSIFKTQVESANADPVLRSGSAAARNARSKEVAPSA